MHTSLHRGHTILCIITSLVYVLPKQGPQGVLFVLIYLFLSHVWGCFVYMSVYHMHAVLKRPSDPRELKLQMVVSQTHVLWKSSQGC